jgi:hypothetical protein
MRFRVLISLFWLALLDGRPASAQRSDRVPPVAADSIAVMMAAVHHDLLPLDTARALWVQALRADSGTSRADEAFLHPDSTIAVILRDLSPTTKRALRLIGFSPTSPLFKPLRTAFAAHGVWVTIGEGEADPGISDSTMRSAARRYLTPPMQALLDLRMTEQLDPIGGDGAIGVPLDVVGRRLAAADRIHATWPTFAGSGQLEWRRRFYLFALLGGWDNSRAFNQDGAIKPTARTALGHFVEAHPTTESGRLIASVLQMSASNGWHSTARIDSLVAAVWSGCHGPDRC